MINNKNSNQPGFTRTNLPKKDLGGFIPMIILFIVIIIAAIWLVFTRIMHAQQ